MIFSTRKLLMEVRRIFLFVPLLFCLIGSSVNEVYAQKISQGYYVSWEENSSWEDNLAPGTTSLPSPEDDYTINGYINVGGYPAVDSDIFTFNAAKDEYTLTIEGTLVVYGNVDFGNKPMKVVIESGGLFIIFGDLGADNIFIVDSEGSLIVNGVFNKGGEKGEYPGTGNIYAGSYTNDATDYAPFEQTKYINVDLQADLPDVYNFLQNGGYEPLPVELLYFDVRYAQSQVSITWSTASELNNDYFLLEKSKNGRDFVRIGEVSGNGTTNLQMDYSYTDHSPYLGLSYYRLSQTDYDGTTEVFPLASVLFEGTKSFTVGPNPISGSSLKLKISEMERNELLQLNIVDLQGRLVEQRPLKADSFGNVESDFQLDKPLQRGTYIFELVSARQRVYQKVAAE
jgi:hypothetical protein